jgi:hypothetical protein
MKKILTFTILIVVLNNDVFAQRLIINNDSLRVHFGKEKPYKVFEYYDKNHHYNIDYKDIYYDDELKSYLLKWLDIDEYIDYKMEKYREERVILMQDDEFSIVRIKDYIINECKLNYDSICFAPEIYAKYKEKTVDWLVDQEKKQMSEQKDKLQLPNSVLDFHSFAYYPESYLIIKQFADKLNLPVVSETGSLNLYYFHLARMNDPETHTKYDKIIEEFVKTNGYSYIPNSILGNVKSLYNAYGLEKLIEIYQVKRKHIIWSDGTEGRFDSDVLFELLILLKYYYKEEISDKIDNNNMNKYSKEILEAANKLVIQLKQKEKYWMDNMPFNKNK